MPVTRIPEIKSLLEWYDKSRRHPDLLHDIDEADCECLPFGDGYLVVNSDTIAEEIAFGLYQDPFTIGWVATMAVLSDIAACGAEPIGVTFAIQWAYDADQAFKEAVQSGINAALERTRVYQIGGDCSQAERTSITATAIAYCTTPPISRKGLRPGDGLYLFGDFGNAAAMAFQFLLERDKTEFPEHNFRPVADLATARTINPYVSAVIDTSDGILTSLCHLAAVNDLHFLLEWRDDHFNEIAKKYITGLGLPLSLSYIVEHGDYLLLAAIQPEHWITVENKAPHCFRIATVQKDESVLRAHNKIHPFPIFKILDDLALYRKKPSELLTLMWQEYLNLGMP